MAASPSLSLATFPVDQAPTLSLAGETSPDESDTDPGDPPDEPGEPDDVFGSVDALVLDYLRSVRQDATTGTSCGGVTTPTTTWLMDPDAPFVCAKADADENVARRGQPLPLRGTAARGGHDHTGVHDCAEDAVSTNLASPELGGGPRTGPAPPARVGGLIASVAGPPAFAGGFADPRRIRG